MRKPRGPKKITWIIESNGCWKCTSHKSNSSGYPMANRKRKPIQISRLMLNEKSTRPIGMYCLHKCNNNWCINPGHLRWGTPGENMLDKIKCGHGCKIPLNIKSEIARDKEHTARELANKYNVPIHSVYSIKSGKSKTLEIFHIPVLPLKIQRKVTKENVIEIRKSSKSLSWWASKLGIDQSYVSYIRNKKRLAII